MAGGSFFEPEPASIVAESLLALAFRDAFPVSPGHTLVITRRVVPDWFSATADEQAAVLSLVEVVKRQLDEELQPDGYNVGFNAGAAAGQTIFHLHVHVIPRYLGDTADPRGGVRHVLPGGNYLAAREGGRRLWHGPSHALAPALSDVVNDREVDRADIVVSFVMQSGLDVLEPLLDRILDRGGAVRLLVTDYLGITERAALDRMNQRAAEHGAAYQARLFRAGNQSFHPKGYLLSSSQRGEQWTFVGSANASRSGLEAGVEWTLLSSEAATHSEALREFQRLWSQPNSVPLSADLVAGYREAARAAHEAAVVVEPATLGPRPHDVQVEALEALEQTRAEGFAAGLVVMATGLGKTWLAAFDSTRPQFRRVLFVAHREEILRQARAVFRQVRPLASASLVLAGEGDTSADLVFASVQTLTRHLDHVGPEAYDYVVIDEFHHAAAPSYRKVLGHLRPAFLLGLTATPERSDSADLLALCEDNLVYDCSLGEGISRELLTPFAYHGVPDPVDFRPLPWRNGRFDPEALEHAVVSAERTAAAYDAWLARRGSRTLGFCVSQRHADWMAAEFRARGVRAVAAHTGPQSAPRQESLEQLATGELEVIFAVDLFNEGVDVPAIDTVLMLRPTNSSILFLQQIGRGLRRHDGKGALTIVDFVGNHRSFLRPLRILASLVEPAGDVRQALTVGEFVLPPGCSVEYELEAKESLLDLLPRGTRALEGSVAAWFAEQGVRPTPLETSLQSRNPGTARAGWYALCEEAGVLSEAESRVARRHHDLLLEVQSAAMTKSYKMVALRAWLLGSAELGRQPLTLNAALSRTLVLRDPRLLADVTSQELPDVAGVSAERWAEYWRRWPLEHLAGKGGFSVDETSFGAVGQVPVDDAPILAEFLHELVEWKLASYLARKEFGRYRMRVSQTGGRPIVFFDRKRVIGLPEGPTSVVMEGRSYEAHFMKIALNVVREAGSDRNVLPDLLWGWFGKDAGQPGTSFEVEVAQKEGIWHVAPHRPEPRMQTELG